jgi:hypothetical protein
MRKVIARRCAWRREPAKPYPSVGSIGLPRPCVPACEPRCFGTASRSRYRQRRGEDPDRERASAGEWLRILPTTCSGLRSCRLRQQAASGPDPRERHQPRRRRGRHAPACRDDPDAGTPWRSTGRVPSTPSKRDVGRKASAFRIDDCPEDIPSGTRTPRARPAETRREVRGRSSRQGREKRRRRSDRGGGSPQRGIWSNWKRTATHPSGGASTTVPRIHHRSSGLPEGWRWTGVRHGSKPLCRCVVRR